MLINRAKRKKLIWPLLVEKAIAKEYGSYGNLNGGAIDYALMLMTGKPTFRYNLLNDEIQLRIADNSLWLKMLTFVEKGFLLGAGTLPLNEIPPYYKQIAGTHAYAVLDAFEFDGHKLLQLRDPRGLSGWVGEWSAGSSKWNTRLKEKILQRRKEKLQRGKCNGGSGGETLEPPIALNLPQASPVPRNQRTFFVSWEEFLKCFEVIFASIFFDEAWGCEKIRDEWKEGCAGGSTLYVQSVRHNPQYLLSISEESEVFCLLEHLIPASVKKLPKIGFEIYKYNGRLIGEAGNIPELVAIGRYSTERAISLNCALEKGRYVVLLSTYDPGQYGKFTFTMWYPKGPERGGNRKLELRKLEIMASS